MFKQYRLRDYDFKLIIMVIALSVIGIIAIGSAKETVQSKQIMGVMVGIFMMFVLSLFDYTVLLKLYWLMYVGNLFLLALVAFTTLGDTGGGAKRWLELPGGFRFQPSEMAKILLILFFAQFIMKYREKINTFKFVAVSIVLILIPWIFISKQPDLSTSLILLCVFCVIMFVGGLSYRIIFGILAVVVPVAAIGLYLILQPEQKIIENYQKNRILAFINPEEFQLDEAYQQINSVMAIGSGQLLGKGYKNNEISSVKNGDYISAAETDFIFAVIGEEFGFRGGCLVIVLVVGIALECISVARKSRELSGTIIAAGAGALIIFQGYFNIGVATFLLPNTGLPLPFVSYGLTSLWSLYILMGIVLNIRLQCKK